MSYIYIVFILSLFFFSKKVSTYFIGPIDHPLDKSKDTIYYIMINHHISDLVARINNAKISKSKNKKIKIPKTKETQGVLQILEKEGFINIHSLSKLKNSIEISINYIHKIKVVSKPGCRVYKGWKDLHDSYSYISLIRTSQGILPSHDAIVKKLGGEILLRISP